MDQSSVDGTGIFGIFLFSPLDHRIRLGPPRQPIPCQFRPICTNTLYNGLLPSPHPDPPSMALRSELFLQIAQPLQIFLHEDLTHLTLWIRFCQARHMTTPREIACKVRFVTMQDFVLSQTVEKQFLTTVSCVLLVFPWRTWARISFVPASCLRLRASGCIVTVS